MNDSTKMNAILYFLNEEWDTVTGMLDTDQLNYLKLELIELERKMKNSKGEQDMTFAARTFLDAFAEIKPLEFLSVIDSARMRGGSLPEDDDEVKIKILNYCAVIREKIEVKTAGKKVSRTSTLQYK